MLHSKASLTVLPGGRRVLEPPPELREGTVEREIFVHTAASVPDGHFAPEDVGLLAEYTRVAALARYASEELLANAVIGSIANPWLGRAQQCGPPDGGAGDAAAGSVRGHARTIPARASWSARRRTTTCIPSTRRRRDRAHGDRSVPEAFFSVW
jgi:hypothetical protein